MIAEHPEISVIIPAYNAQKYISEAIFSIINQSFQNWELIIVNDGSNDNTQSIVEEYCKKDSRIQIVTQNQSGSALARQTGFLKSRGKYIYFLDADDRSQPDTLKRLKLALETWSETVAAYGSFVIVDFNGNILHQPGPVIRDQTPKNIFERLIERGFLSIGSVCIRRSFLMAEDFSTSLIIGEDWLFWCRLAAKGSFVFVGEEPVLEIRKHNTNKTGIAISVLADQWLIANEKIFSDEVVVQKLPDNRQLIHHQTGKFYIYYEVTKHFWYSQEYSLMGIYLWKTFLAFIVNIQAGKHILDRFINELIIVIQIRAKNFR